MQVAAIGHLNVQLPPAQSLVHVAPTAHSTVQPPPAHELTHVAPVTQTTVQPPRTQLVPQVAPRGHVHEMSAVLDPHVLSLGLPLDPPSRFMTYVATNADAPPSNYAESLIDFLRAEAKAASATKG